jgi:hypothetical protein
VKYWETIADNLSEAGWSWGCVSAIDSNGRTVFIADAHRDDGKRFVVHADEKLTAFLEPQTLCASVRSPNQNFRTNATLPPERLGSNEKLNLSLGVVPMKAS